MWSENPPPPFSTLNQTPRTSPPPEQILGLQAGGVRSWPSLSLSLSHTRGAAAPETANGAWRSGPGRGWKTVRLEKSCALLMSEDKKKQKRQYIWVSPPRIKTFICSRLQRFSSFQGSEMRKARLLTAIYGQQQDQKNKKEKKPNQSVSRRFEESFLQPSLATRLSPSHLLSLCVW